MNTITVNLTEDDYETLNAAASNILAELDRRRMVEQAEQEINRINEQVQEALGRKPGDPWQQPTGAHDAYPFDWTVTHDGKTWKSTVSGNVWEPGVSGWHEEVEEGDYPDFVQPTGAHDAYMMDDVVWFEGELFISVMDSNVWSPSAYPQAWQRFTPPTA